MPLFCFYSSTTIIRHLGSKTKFSIRTMKMNSTSEHYSSPRRASLQRHDCRKQSSLLESFDCRKQSSLLGNYCSFGVVSSINVPLISPLRIQDERPFVSIRSHLMSDGTISSEDYLTSYIELDSVTQLILRTKRLTNLRPPTGRTDANNKTRTSALLRGVHTPRTRHEPPPSYGAYIRPPTESYDTTP